MKDKIFSFFQAQIAKIKMVVRANRLYFFCFNLYYFLLCYIGKKGILFFSLKVSKKVLRQRYYKNTSDFIVLHYTYRLIVVELIQNRTSVMGTFNLSGLETNRVFFSILY